MSTIAPRPRPVGSDDGEDLSDISSDLSEVFSDYRSDSDSSSDSELDCEVLDGKDEPSDNTFNDKGQLPSNTTWPK